MSIDAHGVAERLGARLYPPIKARLLRFDGTTPYELATVIHHHPRGEGILIRHDAAARGHVKRLTSKTETDFYRNHARHRSMLPIVDPRDAGTWISWPHREWRLMRSDEVAVKRHRHLWKRS